MNPTDDFGWSLPPGCRHADLDRGSSRLDALSPAQLWRLLDEQSQWRLLRRFLSEEWESVAEFLDGSTDKPPRDWWLAWRDREVSRMAMEGEIAAPPRQGRRR